MDISKINEKLKARYSKDFAKINENVYQIDMDSDGNFEVPVIRVVGDCVSTGKGQDAFKVKSGKVEQNMMKLKGLTNVVDIEIDVRDIEITEKNEAYFKHFFDCVISEAIKQYRNKVGPSDKYRWGVSYLEVPQFIYSQGDDFAHLRMIGKWASDDQDVSGAQ